MEPENGKTYKLTFTMPIRISLSKFSSERSKPRYMEHMVYGGRHTIVGKCMVCGRWNKKGAVRVFVDMDTGNECYISDHCWTNTTVKEVCQ